MAAFVEVAVISAVTLALLGAVSCTENFDEWIVQVYVCNDNTLYQYTSLDGSFNNRGSMPTIVNFLFFYTAWEGVLQ